jgi:rhodanese-related sulfurtransferase
MVGYYRYSTTMSVKRVPPQEAAELLAQGWKYVDVRSVPEFEAGHPEGAYNVPIIHFVPGRGRMPNPDFQAVLEQKFGKDEKLVLGCASGPRSNRAAELMTAWGWQEVVDMAGGFEGERDMMTGRVILGWKASGLPVETAAPGRTWEELKKPGS